MYVTVHETVSIAVTRHEWLRVASYKQDTWFLLLDKYVHVPVRRKW